MYLFIDTETTGTNLARDRVVQIAWIVASDNGQIEQAREYIIRPDGFYIPTRVSEIHGITTERAEAEGHSLSKVLKLLHTDAGRIDYVVAHNVSFDLGMLRREFVEVDIKFPFDSSTHICTMMSSVNYCRLQKLNGMNGYKRPTLNELHFNLFKKYFDGAHNAMSDTQACMRCFFELKRLGVILLSGQSSLTPRATIISSTQSREAGRAERDRTEEDRLRRDRENDAKKIAEYKSHMARQNAELDRANRAKKEAPDEGFMAEYKAILARRDAELKIIDSNLVAIRQVPTTVSSSNPTFTAAVDTIAGRGKKWSYCSETKVLRNCLSSAEYPPSKYIRDEDSSYVKGYKILHGDDIWVNDFDIEVVTTASPPFGIQKK